MSQLSLFDDPFAPEPLVMPADTPRYVLRDYQRKTVDKVHWSMKLPGNDLISLPTGAGKSIVLSSIAEELNQKVLILQPTKELLEQNLSKLSQYVPARDIGIFSASMGRKDINKFTFGTIGSIYKYPELFTDSGLMIVDECHLLDFRKEAGMYSSFIAAVNDLRSRRSLDPMKVIGLTATPYRLINCYERERGFYGEELLICQVGIKLINRMTMGKGKPVFWNRLLININNKELVDQGYLCPLRYEKADLIRQEDIPLNKTKSDFDLEAYEQKVKGKDGLIVDQIRDKMPKHKSILFFCPSIAQAFRLHKITPDIERNSAVVTGKTPAKEREKMINGFKDGSIHIIFNVGVLSLGFDHPALDCIMLNRPTRSIGWYYQALGRGVRLFPGKEFCQVVDFTNTVEQIGPIESLELVKTIDPDRDDPRYPQPKWNLRTATGLWNGRILYRWVKELPKREAIPLKPFDAFGDRGNDLEF